MIMFVTMEDGSTDKQEHEYSIVSRYELIADQCRHVDFSRYEFIFIAVDKTRNQCFCLVVNFQKVLIGTIDTQGTGWLWQWW